MGLCKWVYRTSIVMLAAIVLLSCTETSFPSSTIAPEATPVSTSLDTPTINPPTPEATATPPPTRSKTETNASSTPNFPALDPPAHHLQAWHVAGDGAVFVLDATYSLYKLAANDLLPLAKSEPLVTVVSSLPTFLLSSDTHLFIGIQTDNAQTFILNRSDFSRYDTLDHAGPIALDATTQQLFLIPEFEPNANLATFNGRFLMYTLTNLRQPPVELELSCWYPQDLVTNTSIRRLYVRSLGSCSSPPHQPETFVIYDLDTLTEIAQSEPQLGRLTRPAIAPQTDTFFATLYAKSGFPADNKLFLFDSQGQLRNNRVALDGLPLLDPPHTWLYLLRERGLWIYHADDMVLQSICFFDQPPPADLAISPTGKTLYLFGNDWLSSLPAVDLQTMGIP